MLNEEGFYEKFFKSLITENVHITGDFTPSYALLKKDHFKRIKLKLESKGFKVKVIFLMRDPIDRSISGYNKNISFNEDFKTFFNSFANKRSYYYETILNLEKVFNKEDIFYYFFEKIFIHKNDIFEKELGNFINEKLKKFNYNKENTYFLKNIKNTEINFELNNEYFKTLNFCNNKFPDLKLIWKNIK